MTTRTLSDQDVEEIAQRVAEKVVPQLLESIGFDISSADSRANIRRDNQWVREWREGGEKARSTVIGFGLTTIVGGAIWLLWESFLQVFKSTGKS